VLSVRVEAGRVLPSIEDGLLVVIFLLLSYGNLVYQISRVGYFKRLRAHRPASRDELEAVYDSDPPAVVVLIPSYREELEVIRQTLMSAALMEYPGKRVALLIDDPPNSSDPSVAADLAATRHLTREVEILLRSEERKYSEQLNAFEHRRAAEPLNPSREARRIAGLYIDAASWLEAQADSFEVIDHTDALFVERILREPARAHRARSAEIAARATSRDTAMSGKEIAREYRRLASLFAVRIASFERKRFENMPHAPNKATNLNSYLGMIGRNFREVIRPTGLHLEECDDGSAQLRVPAADYVVTLDADSLLMHDYALRLITVMEQPESRRYAVAGSPYSAIRGSSSRLERVAGAQTDAQWIMSQGLTHYRSGFWVGANAVLRREALEDICQISTERGYPVRKYIQDRTLVEDTESTIDLVARGWTLFNYPERLSYSATPRDFGTLIIQRRRWSNGGLLIVPNLVRYFISSPLKAAKIPETLLRLHYLVSPTTVNLGMLLLLCIPFKDAVPSLLLIVAAAPYYILYGRDLVAYDYGWLDVLRIYALNLLLIPVNLAGVAQSVKQAFTGRVVAFARTPKIKGRVSSPRSYLIAIAVITVLSCLAAISDLRAGKLAFSLFGFSNAAFYVYALIRIVGARDSWTDVVGGVDDPRELVQSRPREEQAQRELAASQG
jgi:cellulose synthase/poly-beta-1,6-N-acetylglucosamine synthase-like glycosyltransferase